MHTGSFTFDLMCWCFYDDMYNSITFIDTFIKWCRHQWAVLFCLAIQRAQALAVRHEKRVAPPYLLNQPEGDLASYTSVCCSNALTRQSLGSGLAAAPRKAHDRPLRLTRLCSCYTTTCSVVAGHFAGTLYMACCY